MNLRSKLLAMAAGLACIASAVPGQQTLFTLDGTTNRTFLGSWVEGVGDVNGDGTEDFVAGEYLTASVRSGLDGAVLFTVPMNVAGLGMVRAAGDVNANGVPDLITGFLDFTLGTARFQVYDGSGALLHDIQAPPMEPFWAEVSLDGVGDVDGDGYDDLILGVPYTVGLYGAAFVHSGRDGSLLYSYSGINGGDNLGMRVSGVGDLDGDGRPDYSISTPAADDPVSGLVDCGRVQFFSGRDGTLIGERFGRASGDFLFGAEGLGDVNGDGFLDVALSAPYASRSAPLAGLLEVAFGPDWVQGYTLEGTQNFELFGLLSYGSAGDLDGDGLPDLIVGAMQNHQNGPASGRVMTCRGHDGTFFHEYFGSELGFLSAVGAFDQNGDGLGDLLLGSFGADHNRGQVQVIRTCPARWSGYGQGFPGRTGIPELAPRWDPVLGEPLTLDVGNSAGANTVGVLLVGTDKASQPMRSGATLLVDPLWLVPLTIPAGGTSLSRDLDGDPALWCGVELDLQLLVLDAAASGGLSFSRGVELLPGFAYP